MPSILSVPNGYLTSVNNRNVSITVDGSATLLVVAITTEDTSSHEVTSMTYDGVALTRAVRNNFAGGGDLIQSIWYLVNPSTGSNTLAMNTDGETVNDVSYAAYSLNDVDTDDPIHATNTKNVGSGSPNVNITTTIDDTLLIECFGSEASSVGDMTVGSGQTQRRLDDYGADGGGISDKPAPTAGTYTMEWDFPDDDEENGSAVVAIAPAGGAATLTVSHTTDALLVEDDSQIRSHTTDSLLRKENTKTHTTSASLALPEAVQLTGFETGGVEESVSTAGSVSVQSSVKRTGDYALRVNPTSSTAEYEIGGNVDPGDNGVFLEGDVGSSIWLRIASAPTSDTRILQLFAVTDTEEIGVRLNTDRTLSLVNETTQIGSDSAAIPLDTWVLIGLKAKAGTSSNAVAGASLNGSEFASTTSATTASQFRYMKIGTLDSTTADLYFDDYFLHDRATYPGSRKIYNLKPNGAGDLDEWSGGFSAIDDIPIDELDARTTSTVDDQFTNAVEDISTYSVTGDIVGIKPWIWWKSPDANGAVTILLRDGFITLGGSDVNSTASQLLAQVYGSDASNDPWTESIVNDLEVGADMGVAPSSGFVSVYAAGIMLAEAEDVTPVFSKSHTTDANIKDQNTVNHSTSSNLKEAEVELSHSTDSFLKIRDSVDHTTDSLLKEVANVSHTTNALLRESGDVSHDTDALLRDRNTISHTTDAFLKQRDEVEHTTDSYLQDRNSINHTTDALLRSAETVDHDTDAALRSRETLDHTTNSFLKQTESRSHTTDALVRDSQSISHDTDSLLRSQENVQHTTDTVLKVQDDVSHTTDAFMAAQAVLGHTTNANLRDVNTVQHTTNSFIRSRETLVHTTDATMKEVENQSHTTDSFLRKAETVDHTTDSNLREVITISHTTSSSILGENAQSHSADSLLRAVAEVSHSTDSFLLANKQSQHTTDSILKKAGIQATHTTDSTLTEAGMTDHTTDAVLNGRGVIGHTTNAFLRLRETASHTADSLLKRTFETEHDTDALLRVETQLTHTTDAVLSVQATATHTTDAFIILQAVKTHTTDASIQNNVRTSHTTDTTLAVRDTLAHSTDADLTNRYTESHTTDARLYCNPKRPTIVVEVDKPLTEFTLVVKATTMYNQDNKPTTAYKEC